MSDTPDDKFTPEAIIDPYRAEIARLRGLLVKACKEIAADRMAHSSPGTQWPIANDIAEQYGVRLRWRKRRGWTEDTGK